MAQAARSKGIGPFKTALFFYPAPTDLSTYLPEKESALLKVGAGGKEVMVLETNSLETTDIFRGAFFLCTGGELNGIRFTKNGKRIASFLFTGRGLDKLDKQYRDGQALVNPLQFRESLNHLRDILFNELRENGETRYDRKRKDRGYQARR